MDRLEEDLEQGKYNTGDRLPSLMDLSKSLKVNHLTVRRGLESLAKKGLLDIRPRVGVFVTQRSRPLETKTKRIVLGCRQFMLEVTEHHPALAAYIAGAHNKKWSGDVSIQTMFYHRHKMAQEIGPTILSQKIDGVVACSGGICQADIDFFKKHNVPLVQCGQDAIPDEWSPSVSYSSGAPLKQGIEHLRSLGHQRIAFVCWQYSGDSGAVQRDFARLAFDHQLGDARELLVLVSNPEGNARWQEVENFFDLKPLPSAVVMFDEFMADVLLSGCARRGIRVPEDLSVVTLNDSLPFGHRVPLTAPDSNRFNIQMVQSACDILDLLIDGKPIPQRNIQLIPEMIVKASSGPAPLRREGATT